MGCWPQSFQAPPGIAQGRQGSQAEKIPSLREMSETLWLSLSHDIVSDQGVGICQAADTRLAQEVNPRFELMANEDIPEAQEVNISGNEDFCWPWVRG